MSLDLSYVDKEAKHSVLGKVHRVRGQILSILLSCNIMGTEGDFVSLEKT